MKRRRPFYVEGMDEAEAKKLHRDVVEWMPDDPFLQELVADFRFPDPAALIAVLVEANTAGLAGYADPRPADTLNKLSAPLDDVIRLLEDERNAYRLFWELAKSAPGREAQLDDDLARLPDWLREIQAAAIAAHKDRDPAQKKTGPLPLGLDLRELLEKLARFWVDAKGGRFEQNQNRDAWTSSSRTDGIEEPSNRKSASAFVFRVIEYLAPERLPEVKALLPEVAQTVNPRIPGRGRPRKLSS